jgi:hypothetical protein
LSQSKVTWPVAETPIVNLSDILSDLYQSYDENLVKTVRVIDTIIYNKKIDSKLKININLSKESKKVEQLDVFEM